jgi:hypothetical protein
MQSAGSFMADARLKAEAPPSVIILGMHRSGTSLVAGSLEAAGLFLGEVNTAAPFNRRGNRENEGIRAFNERLLARAGAAWNRPPKEQVAWVREDEVIAFDLIRPYLDHGRPWGFKDPRSLWTVEGWLPVLRNPRIVAVVRHPTLVAKSLAARSGSLHVSYDDGLALWQTYNVELLRFARALRFPILHFSTDPDQWNHFADRLELISRQLGLPHSSRPFYAAELVHQRNVEGAVPKALQNLFDALCAEA